jgi:hypothetical protein
VGLGQVNSERDILGNRYGSARYAAFLAGDAHYPQTNLALLVRGLQRDFVYLG